MPNKEIAFTQWMALGVTNGWCSGPACIVHEGLPQSYAEYESFGDADLCVYGVRLFQDGTERNAVLEHNPTMKREMDAIMAGKTTLE